MSITWAQTCVGGFAALSVEIMSMRTKKQKGNRTKRELFGYL